MGDYFRSGSVFIKKKLPNEIFFKKNQNRTETSSNRPVRFFRTKTGLNRFGSVFSCLTRFFLFGFDSIRFDFFGFRLIKPKPNQIGQFFKILINLIGFFSRFGFFNYFFSSFPGLISFLIF